MYQGSLGFIIGFVLLAAVGLSIVLYQIQPIETGQVYWARVELAVEGKRPRDCGYSIARIEQTAERTRLQCARPIDNRACVQRVSRPMTGETWFSELYGPECPLWNRNSQKV